jgi:hypothetical protein
MTVPWRWLASRPSIWLLYKSFPHSLLAPTKHPHWILNYELVAYTSHSSHWDRAIEWPSTCTVLSSLVNPNLQNIQTCKWWEPNQEAGMKLTRLPTQNTRYTHVKSTVSRQSNAGQRKSGHCCIICTSQNPWIQLTSWYLWVNIKKPPLKQFCMYIASQILCADTPV